MLPSALITVITLTNGLSIFTIVSKTPFYLSPILTVTGIIDNMIPEGYILFDKLIEKLNKELFDYKLDDLYMFIDALKERVLEMGWYIPGVGIIDIFINPIDPNLEYINILTYYGKLTLEQIRAFESIYIHQPLCTAQDTYAIYHCIINSLSKEAIKKISI